MFYRAPGKKSVDICSWTGKAWLVQDGHLQMASNKECSAAFFIEEMS